MPLSTVSRGSSCLLSCFFKMPISGYAQKTADRKGPSLHYASMWVAVLLSFIWVVDAKHRHRNWAPFDACVGEFTSILFWQRKSWASGPLAIVIAAAEGEQGEKEKDSSRSSIVLPKQQVLLSCQKQRSCAQSQSRRVFKAGVQLRAMWLCLCDIVSCLIKWRKNSGRCPRPRPQCQASQFVISPENCFSFLEGPLEASKTR